MKEHEKILQRAMRDSFRPHGLIQQGRSRLWFDDHGWWLAVVELQPSSWSKGTYLNVGAMWLPFPREHVFFDYGYRRNFGDGPHRSANEFLEFKDPARFEEGARRVCESALAAVDELRGSIVTYGDALSRQEALLAAERAQAGPIGPWNVLFTGVFALLSGHTERAAELARELGAYPAQWDWAHKMKPVGLELLHSPDPHGLASQHVDYTRQQLKLPPWNAGVDQAAAVTGAKTATEG